MNSREPVFTDYACPECGRRGIASPHAVHARPGPLPAVPHPPELCYGSRLHCWWHNEDEDDRGAYRACLECGHVYRTAQALADAWDEQWPGSRGGQPGAALPGCAYCSHDF